MLDPEIYLQIPCAAEFSVPNLEGDGHLVIFVELFMKAFSGVGAEVDVVGCDEGCEEEKGDGDQIC